MTRWPQLWATIITLSALGAGFVTFAQVESPIRAVIAFWFLLFCPGMAFVRLFRIREVVFEWPVAIGLSFALDTLVAGAMLYAGVWSAAGSLLVLIGISICGASFQVTQARPSAGGLAPATECGVGRPEDPRLVRWNPKRRLTGSHKDRVTQARPSAGGLAPATECGVGRPEDPRLVRWNPKRRLTGSHKDQVTP